MHDALRLSHIGASARNPTGESRGAVRDGGWVRMRPGHG